MTVTLTPRVLLSVVSASVLVQDDATPLHAAAQEGQLPVAQLLLKAGADIEAKDNVSWRGGE